MNIDEVEQINKREKYPFIFTSSPPQCQSCALWERNTSAYETETKYGLCNQYIGIGTACGEKTIETDEDFFCKEWRAR